jgi:hypothetical protein
MATLQKVIVYSPAVKQSHPYSITVDDWEEVITDCDPYYYYDVIHNLNNNNFIVEYSDKDSAETHLTGSVKMNLNIYRIYVNSKINLDFLLLELP